MRSRQTAGGCCLTVIPGGYCFMMTVVGTAITQRGQAAVSWSRAGLARVQLWERPDMRYDSQGWIGAGLIGMWLLTMPLSAQDEKPAKKRDRSQKQAKADRKQPRPQIQFLNASDGVVELFWLASDTERVPSGEIAPGQNKILTTTLGHQFELVSAKGQKAQVTSEVLVQGYRFEPGRPDGIPAVYTQKKLVDGYPIVASAKVNPFALEEAAYLVRLMLSERPDVREAMIKSGSRMCIMAYDEFTTDLPEFRWLGSEDAEKIEGLPAKEYWDRRARGLGGSETDPFCSVAEENLLAFEGDPYAAECILIHEFAHNIHLRGMVNVDPTFDGRLKATYEQAMQTGKWKGKYAAENHHEYFAEGVQSWFDNNRVNDDDHNHVNTRELLKEYDPGLAAMCEEVFGKTVIKYTKPVTRLTGHLKGYDPSKSPKFEWPKQLDVAQRKIRKRAEERNRQTKPSQPATATDSATPDKSAVKTDATADAKAEVTSATHETRKVSGWTVYVNRELLKSQSEATEKALVLLKAQLDEIVRVVPAGPVQQLQEVPLWMSPEYKGIGPKAEYHPDAGWLKNHDRNVAMARGIEFTNVRIFDAECRRMPNFALHELAHAYHHRVLPDGFDNPLLRGAYERAKKEGRYERVERRDANGKTTLDRSYALTNPQEFFAELSESYFSRNDFYPYVRTELERHDPESIPVLERLWKVSAAK